jgi:hypothetical protein
VQKILGSPDATKTMTRDHVEVGFYIEELASLRNALVGEVLTTAQSKSLQRVLYGVYGLVKIHFAKEEEVYLPILDRVSPPNPRRRCSKRWKPRRMEPNSPRTPINDADMMPINSLPCR